MPRTSLLVLGALVMAANAIMSIPEGASTTSTQTATRTASGGEVTHTINVGAVSNTPTETLHTGN